MRAALSGLVLCVACNTHAFSPPAGGFPIESAAGVGAGRHAAGVDYSYASTVFGPAASAVRLKYRHGLSDQLELSAAPSAIIISGADRADSHPAIYALRAALKYTPIPHAAASFGAAGGGSAGGAFLSPDVGLTLGYENRYLVPFASGHMFVSAPIAPRAVHFTIDDDSGSSHDENGTPDHYKRTPHFSYGVQFSFGLRVPLYAVGEPGLRPSLSCAVGGTFLYDRSPEHEGFIGLGCGAEFGF